MDADRRLNENVSKILIIFSGLLFGTANFWLVTYQPIFPRPFVYFITTGLSITLIFLAVLITQSRKLLSLNLFLICVIGLGMRLSGYLVVIASGIDYSRWIARVDTVISNGHIVGGDMYQASPLYILSLVVPKLVLDISLQNIRFISISGSLSMILLVCIFTHMYTKDVKISVISSIIVAITPFFLRTATLLEAEYFVVPWFVLIGYLFVSAYQNGRKRNYILYSWSLFVLITLHFFYATVIISLYFSTSLLLKILQDKTRVVQTEAVKVSGSGSKKNLNGLILASLIGIVVLPVWMLWSTYAGTTVITLLSVFTVPEITDIFSIFIPQSDAVGASTGGGTSTPNGRTSDGLQSIYRLVPVILLFSLAAVGALLSILRREYKLLITISTILTSTTIGLLIIDLDYNLSFRMYYFLAAIAVIFSAIFINHITIESKKKRTLGILLTVSIVLTMSITGLISPVGNNVDPRFGGESWAITKSEYIQIESMNGWIQNGEYVADPRIDQFHPYFSPTFNNQELYLSDDCKLSNSIGTSGKFNICYG